MNDKLKESFDKIHAEESLKDTTKRFLAQKTQGYTNDKPIRYRLLVPVAACLLFILLGCSSVWIYFTPTATISIDINPSVELGINRFDKVVSVNGYKDDGKALADGLQIDYMDYTDAVNQILQDGTVAALLSQDEVLTIAVIGSDGQQCERILSNMETCTAGHKNAHCYAAEADAEDVAAAHDLGLSYGKYRAYLKLCELGSDITPEEIKDMTMREIRELLRAHTSAGQDDASQAGTGTGAGTGAGHHGSGSGHGRRHGSGNSGE